MKTLPTAITTGISTNLAQFWLVKVEGSTLTYYWTTSKKNLTAQNLILKQTIAGDPALTVDSGMIAKMIDDEEQAGISQIEFGVDISQGGGIASAADVEIDILNQDRLDTTILATPNRFEYRPVTLYMGYIPAGASPTVYIDGDMLQMWTGVVEGVLDFDYGHFRLKCVDGVFFRHKELPLTVIDASTYAAAPEESIGQILPILYGDFFLTTQTPTDSVIDQKYGRFNYAPLIMIDEVNRIFALSDHAVKTFLNGNEYFFQYDDGGRLYGYISGVTLTLTNSASLVKVAMSKEPITGYFYVQPKNLGELSDTYASTVEAVDDSSSTYVTMSTVGGTDDLFFRSYKYPQNTVNESLTVDLDVIFGTITGTGNLQYKLDGGVATNMQAFGAAQSNSTIAASLVITDPTLLAKYQWGVHLDAASTAQVINISLKVPAKLTSLAGPVLTGYELEYIMPYQPDVT